MRILRPPSLPILLLVLVCCAFARKQSTSVRFHTEANPRDTDVFSTAVPLLPPRQGSIFVSKIPTLSERDITGIFPFVAPDGTNGCAFKLDAHGTIALDTLSVEKRGSMLAAMVHGRHVADLLIDTRVSDGILSVPRGLTEGDIKKLRKKFRLIGGKR